MSRLADAVDAALEWSVVGSFTRLGAAARRRLDRWAPPVSAVAGRVIAITGGTSGLGLAAAHALARAGATVEIVARDPVKAAATCDAIRGASGNPRVAAVIADVGDLDAVRAAAAELVRRHPALDALVHNAGALDDEYHTSPQGLERTVASHVVGPSLLTERLVPALRAAAPARVLWVSSGGMYTEPLAVDRLELARADYRGVTAYARAKRAQVTLAALWGERLAADGITVHALHPGWVDTPGVARSLPRFRRALGPALRAPADGIDTLLWLLTDPGAPLATTGRFWHDRRPRSIHRLAKTARSDTPAERARLWSWVAEQARRGEPA